MMNWVKSKVAELTSFLIYCLSGKKTYGKIRICGGEEFFHKTEETLSFIKNKDQEIYDLINDNVHTISLSERFEHRVATSANKPMVIVNNKDINNTVLYASILAFYAYQSWLEKKCNRSKIKELWEDPKNTEECIAYQHKVLKQLGAEKEIINGILKYTSSISKCNT